MWLADQGREFCSSLCCDSPFGILHLTLVWNQCIDRKARSWCAADLFHLFHGKGKKEDPKFHMVECSVMWRKNKSSSTCFKVVGQFNKPYWISFYIFLYFGIIFVCTIIVLLLWMLSQDIVCCTRKKKSIARRCCSEYYINRSCCFVYLFGKIAIPDLMHAWNLHLFNIPYILYGFCMCQECRINGKCSINSY